MRNKQVFLSLLLMAAFFLTVYQYRAGHDLQMVQSGFLAGTLVDAGTGNPLTARIYARGADQELYIDEEGILYERPNLEGPMGTSGRHFTTRKSNFLIRLPAGKAGITVERGKEYVPLTIKVNIREGDTLRQVFRMQRWIDMAEKGWYSGDMHVHRSLDEMETLLPAEDLNIALVQTQWNTDAIPVQVKSWFDETAENGWVAIDPVHQFNILGSEIEDYLGIGALTYLLPSKEKAPIPGIGDYYNSTQYLASSRFVSEAGGFIEIEKPFWREAPVHAALGEPSFIGIINNHLIREGFLEELGWPRSIMNKDYPEGEQGYILYNYDLYYQFLNAGFHLMPTAGSASGALPNPLGYNRVYVKVEGAFTPERWLEGLKAGRSFVSNGPLLDIQAGKNPLGSTLQLSSAGKVEVKGTVYSATSIDRIEIVQDGRVAVVIPVTRQNGFAVKFEEQIPFTSSGWLAVRCFEKKTTNYRTAHSAPVFVEVGGKTYPLQRTAVQWFIDRINDLIADAEKKPIEPSKNDGFKTREQKEATLELYRQALKFYEKRIADQ